MSNLSWDEIAIAFAEEAAFCKGYSSLYETICAHTAGIVGKHVDDESLAAEERALVDLLEVGWSERALQNKTEATLLLLGGIHASVLNDDPAAALLRRFYATAGGSFAPESDGDALIQALGGFFLQPSDTLRQFLSSGQIQTNEVSRGVAWLLPAIVLGSTDLPITLIDLGCSAGLNLAADAQSWHWTVDGGADRYLGNANDVAIMQQLDFEHAESFVWASLPPGELPRPQIVKRVGIDRAPLNVTNPADLLTLRACIWGDQADRMARFDHAIDAYKRLEPAPEFHAADIIDAARHLHTHITPQTRLLVAYSTVVAFYMEDAEYMQLRSNIEESFRALPRQVQGIWVELENARAGEPQPPSKLFPIKMHTLDNDHLTMRHIAYTEPHPQTIRLLPGWV